MISIILFYSHPKTQHVVTCCERLHASANIAQKETTMLRVVASVCTGLNEKKKTLTSNGYSVL